jgi:protein O-mannose beta-1,4-N-acetylglucosaminyltransferase
MQEKVKNTKTVPPHKCCTSPYWLYRIYQDTNITIKEVIDVIQDGLVESRKVLKDLRTINLYVSELSPPTVKHIRCLNYENRPPGTLWAAWDEPWTGFKVDQWNILLDEDGREFATDTNATSVSIGGFQKNETVRFFVRALYGGKPHKKGEWGTRGECVV